MAKDSPFKMAHEFEKRTREELENVKFPWNVYFPWCFLGDVLFVAAIVVAITYWVSR